MDNIPKVTIEKRTIKINGNEDFILEYPSNYNDIVGKKLENLEKEYDESQIQQESSVNNNEKIEEENNDFNDINGNENQNECYASLDEQNENNDINGVNNDEINHENTNDININDDEEGFQAVTVIEPEKKVTNDKKEELKHENNNKEKITKEENEEEDD